MSRKLSMSESPQRKALIRWLQKIAIFAKKSRYI